MGRIFCIIGKSSSGKDTIYKKLLEEKPLGLKRIISYTTRPIRADEHDGVEYHFVSEDELAQMENENRVIECRSYNTIHGVWYYFTAKDSHLELEENNYIVIGTLESYLKTRAYFGAERVIPIYIEVEDGERLTRALNREKNQSRPKYEEMCRRYLADAKDFSEENLKNAGISRLFKNDCLGDCMNEIIEYIESFQ